MLASVDLVSFCIGLAVGIFPCLIFVIWRGFSAKAMEAQFKAAAQEALLSNQAHFITLAEAKLKQAGADGAHDLEKRQKAIADLVDPVNKVLTQMDQKIQELEKARVGAYAELQTYVRTMSEDQGKLRRETASLVQALRSPSTRGQWGEMQLKRCLEMSGMKQGIHFEEQVSTSSEDFGNQQPDIVINLSGGKCVVVDSKAPIDAYLDSLREGISEEERRDALMRHARHVRDHIKKLSLKSYWSQFDSPEFVVMFLPGESYFSAALEIDPALIEAGVEQKVIPATPTTLISLLKAVMYGWRQEQMAENARAIAALGGTLHDRLVTFTGHLDKVGKGLTGALNGYNAAVASLETRVLVTARELRDMHVTENAEIESPAQIDHVPRALSNMNEAAE